MVCLNDLVAAGNQWRVARGLPLKYMQQLLGNSAAFREFAEAAARSYRLPQAEMLQVVGKGNKTKTMGHFSLAVFVAEQLSPDFHVEVIKTFVEGKLLEFREQGGTEFKALNAAIDLYLPDRVGKDNRGCYITIAKIIRARLLGVDDPSWDAATVAQTHSRYTLEAQLVRNLSGGFVSDWDQLKLMAERL
jgi:hypothetical protein